MFDNEHEFKYKDASCEVHVDGDIGIVMRVYSKARSRGHGKGLLRLVTEWADENNLELRLHARAYGHPVQTILDNNQLVRFYKSFGFVEDPEHEVVGAGTMMVRYSATPRTKNTPYSEREN